MSVYWMVVMIVLIVSISSIIKSKRKDGHSKRSAKKAKSGDYDYQAWSEGQHSNERQTKKEIELFKLKKAERDETRKTYERIVMEKLDVMKTAISMGMDKDGLSALDSRLEKLIGQDKLERLIDDEVDVPEVSADLMDSDLQGEIERLQRSRQAD